LKFFVYKALYDYEKYNFTLLCCDEDYNKFYLKKPFMNYHYTIEPGPSDYVKIHPFEGEVFVKQKFGRNSGLMNDESKIVYNRWDIELKYLIHTGLEFMRWYEEDAEEEGTYFPLDYVTSEQMKNVIVAFDIEIDFPEGVTDIGAHLQTGDFKITSISFVDGFNNKTIVANSDYFDSDIQLKDIDVWIVPEKELINLSVDFLLQFPAIAGYNSSQFDELAIYFRAQKIGAEKALSALVYNPRFQYVRVGSSISYDMFFFLKNRAVKGYVYWNSYLKLSLDSVSEALLGESKLEVDFGEYNAQYLEYCVKDSELVMKLLYKFNLDMILMMSRIFMIDTEDLIHRQISYWNTRLIKYYMYKNDYLIPGQDYISLRAKSERRPYPGAITLNPVPGFHTNIRVFDFSSLYPSILLKYNVSFETIDCEHPKCKVNMIPGTNHYHCSKRIGIIPKIIGEIFDKRMLIKDTLAKVSNYAEPDSPHYEMYLEQFVYKIIMNAMYGLLGYWKFFFFNVNAAESITLNGQHWIKTIKRELEELGDKVLYGDTDSFFVDSTKSEDEILKIIREFCDLRLEHEKTYKYLIMTNKKKNYLGLKDSGKLDIKGLTLKKTNSPFFFADVIKDIEKLGKIEGLSGILFEENIVSIFRKYYLKLNRKRLSREKLKIRIRVAKDPNEYKNENEIVKLYKQTDLKVEKGKVVEYYKSISGPRSLDSENPVDWTKYKEILLSAAEQIVPKNIQKIQGNLSIMSFM